MRHRTVISTFGRSSSHRSAMLSSLVCNLIVEKRIKTTLTRAKSARRVADKMVTLAKNGSLSSRRKAMAFLRRKNAVDALFKDIAPHCEERSGGYTRITKLGQRVGDNSTMAVMEWVSVKPVDKKKKRKPEEEKTAAPETQK